MKRGKALLIFVLVGLCACAPARTMTKGSYLRLSRDTPIESQAVIKAGAVDIFYKLAPGYPFVEIGIVEAFAQGDNAGLADVFAELQRQAAMLGCDGVYKIELQRYTQAGDALHATGIAVKKQ